MSSLTITLIGGPTALIEIDGLRLLTDPTFDAPGAYQLPHVKLEKLSGPALGTEAIGDIDAVLLSHDQHADNLDHSGKDFLPRAKRVLTTIAGARRLGGHAEGLAPWASVELTGGAGHSLTVTATPARFDRARTTRMSDSVRKKIVGQGDVPPSESPASPEPVEGRIVGVDASLPARSRPRMARTRIRQGVFRHELHGGRQTRGGQR